MLKLGWKIEAAIIFELSSTAPNSVGKTYQFKSTANDTTKLELNKISLIQVELEG